MAEADDHLASAKREAEQHRLAAEQEDGAVPFVVPNVLGRPVIPATAGSEVGESAADIFDMSLDPGIGTMLLQGVAQVR